MKALFQPRNIGRLKTARKRLRFLIFYVRELPAKSAGVGLARKIGMDEAVRRFARIPGFKPSEGVIVCFDADSLCLPNYLEAIEAHFSRNKETPACSIYYEHPIAGEFDKKIYEGIIKYELFLRYYVHALRFAGFPYAYQTIGSAMAVRLPTYLREGGMNKKKAGEDFYFLHKIIPLGNFSELTETVVVPSPRISNRVPFGTGKAVHTWVTRELPFYPAYHPTTILALKELIYHLPALFDTPYLEWLKHRRQELAGFLTEQNFDEALDKIRNQSPDNGAFIKKTFDWLNAFRILKLVHYCRDRHWPDVPVEDAASWLIEESTGMGMKGASDLELLSYFRKWDSGENPGEKLATNSTYK